MSELWKIIETSFDIDQPSHAETVFTIGNGYLGTRGAFEEWYPNEQRTTFVHGVFDDLPIFFTELANFPDWLDVEILLAGERFSMAYGQLLDFERCLDLHTGLLTRTLRWRSPQGRTTRLEFRRFASLANPHLACLQVAVTPEDYEGSIEWRSGLDAGVDNLRYKHWDWMEQGIQGQTGWLRLRTHATGIEAGIAERIGVDSAEPVEYRGCDPHGRPTLSAQTQAGFGKTVSLEKTISIVTGRDEIDPLAGARARLEALPTPAWPSLWQAHAHCWEEEWQRCDVIIEGDDQAQLAMRFNLFNLLIAAPRHDEHVNIGAKTLSGYGYRGHSFWDTEIFMLPFFTYTRPEIARNLLSYRYHNLPGAREKAAADGYLGAQYPWESGGDGREVTPTWVPHPTDHAHQIRIWTGDIEIHISADIAYAIWQYWKATGDDEFMRRRGAEVILDTARFWASRVEWNPEEKRYEINDIIGPDEYHDHVDNNIYTNELVRWHLRTALFLLDWLKNYDDSSPALIQKLGITPADADHWRHIIEHIYIAYNPKTHLLEQFEGYFKCADVDLASLEPRDRSVQSIFGEEASHMQVLKQPDALMLLYLLPDLYDETTLRANYAYYTPRTDHTFGSSLGPSIQTIMACRVGRIEEAYEHFDRAARVDLFDMRGNSADGIHGASAGGLWQAAVFGFAGLALDEKEWKIAPRLPAHWKRLSFKFMHRGQPVTVDIDHRQQG